MAKKCGRLARWWHGRMRAADRKFMVPLLIGNARLSSDDLMAASNTFAMFIKQRGQEHWLCDCATAERHEVMDLCLHHGR